MSGAHRTQPPIFRFVALTWLVVSALVLTWVVLQSGDNAAAGLVSIFLGLPAVIQATLALWLLRSRDRLNQRMLTIILAIPPTMLLLAEPILSVMVIATTAVVLHAAAWQSKTP